MKNKRSSKRIFVGFALLAVVLLLLFSYHKTILIKAGNYLAPGRMNKADVLIMEGGMLVKLTVVKIALDLVSSGKADYLVVVDQDVKGEDIFALSDYPLLVAKNLEALGLKKGQFEVIGVPAKHPVTLTEAKIVLSQLSKKGVRSAILLTQGFHARRSYWAYKRVGLPLGIEIIPCAYFTNYGKENWWQQTEGVEEFLSEFIKFIYYLLRGYIPLKSLFVT
jgi:uncharacterized SAM-binding protein YcdF (DUF218 family)